MQNLKISSLHLTIYMKTESIRRQIMENQKITAVLEGVKKEYLSELPDEAADALIRKLVYLLVTR